MSGGFTIRHAEPVMGTVVSFDIRPHGLPRRDSRAALTRACELLHDADRMFSLYRPDSPMSQIRRGELVLTNAPAAIAEVLAVCEHARKLSDGWFDPWALPGGLDPTGLVKGWAAARAAQALRAAGIGAAMVNAAGDIVTFGRPDRGRSWCVGIRSPDSPDKLLGIVHLGEGAMATSGTYERGAHIHDVRRDRPADAAVSATVRGANLTVADALATALVAAGPAGLPMVRRAGYGALVVDTDGTTAHTDGFSGHVEQLAAAAA